MELKYIFDVINMINMIKQVYVLSDDCANAADASACKTSECDLTPAQCTGMYTLIMYAYTNIVNLTFHITIFAMKNKAFCILFSTGLVEAHFLCSVSACANKPIYNNLGGFITSIYIQLDGRTKIYTC